MNLRNGSNDLNSNETILKKEKHAGQWSPRIRDEISKMISMYQPTFNIHAKRQFAEVSDEMPVNAPMVLPHYLILLSPADKAGCSVV